MTTTAPAKTALKTCEWAGSSELYLTYHDKEWGVPKGDDRYLFEKIILEGFQAGLSWITILKKRENFRKAFDQFDAEKIVKYKTRKIESLMQDVGIIRNKAKIEATLHNARAYLNLREEKSLGAFMWDFVDGTPIQNKYASLKKVPAKTELSEKIAKELKKRGFRFCGPVTVYAFMQSIGMVNDHTTRCPRYEPCAKLAQKFKAPQK